MSKESTGKRITNELRHNIEDAAQLYGCECKRLLAIADRIDAAYNAAYQDGENAILAVFDKRGNADVDERMAEHGWYRALDADKQTIRFYDDVEWELSSSGETERGYVVGIKIDLIADRQSCRVKVVRDSDFQTIELMAEKLHHVKPAEPEPTVEDVLRGVVTLCHNTWKEESPFHFCDVDDVMKSGNIADFAAKLRLAGDAE